MGEEEVYINLLLSLLFNPKKISKQMKGQIVRREKTYEQEEIIHHR